jgi:hypothetical protein
VAGRAAHRIWLSIIESGIGRGFTSAALPSRPRLRSGGSRRASALRAALHHLALVAMLADDHLPIDVLTELGRVAWTAIILEDCADGVCAFIKPANPRTDPRQIGPKVRDALKVLADWPASQVRDDAATWLRRAAEAIDKRNALLHAIPLVGPGGGQAQQFFLGERPRKDRPYFERTMTVEALSELHVALGEAVEGWMEVTLAVGDEAERLRLAG